MATNKESKFIQEMLTAPTIQAAADKAGIARQTAYRYLKDPEVQAQLRSERSKVMEQTRNYLSGNMMNLSRTLMHIIANNETPPAVKIQAINTAFSIVTKLQDEADIMERIVILERKMRID